MVYKIIEWNDWKKPIYFAVTVSSQNKIGLDSYLSMEGMGFRLVKTKGQHQLNAERTRHNLWNVYQYRGLLDDKVYKDANTLKLLSNYRAAYIQLADTYEKQGKKEEAYQVLKHSEAHVPMGWQGLYWATEISHKIGKYEEGIEYAKRCLEQVGYRDPQLILSLGDRMREMGGLDEAIQIYDRIIAQGTPKAREQAYYRLAMAQEKKGAYAEAIQALEHIQKVHSEDAHIAKIIDALRMRQADADHRNED